MDCYWVFSFHIFGVSDFLWEKKKSHFEEMIGKGNRRISAWHSKLLTYGDRYVLIKNILQSLLIYLMSGMNPPKGVIDQIHRIMAKFF